MACRTDQRRARARAEGYNGIDAVNVSEDGRTVTVIFFGSVPDDLTAANFHITGGKRVTGIEVVDVVHCGHEDPELEDRARLTVDRPGDFSTYLLSVVEADSRGRPGTEPYPGFDPRYAAAEFVFTAPCHEVDCAPAPAAEPPDEPGPEIDYLAKDYASFRQLMFDRLTLTMPNWTERHVPDVGVALVELLAYEGERLSYRQDAVATEAYVDTARLRTSVRRHVRLVDYPMHDGCAARAWISVEVDAAVALDAGKYRFATLPASFLPESKGVVQERDLDRRDTPPHEIFEPVTDERIELRPEHNRIPLWTWGDTDCVLPEGTTSATLADGTEDCRVLRLKPGDVLLFEEVRGARTGAEADADHTHKQAVRLVSVTEATDELYCRPVLEVTWAERDALRFPLCVRARGGPECEDLEVAVARGNIVLAEHGRTMPAECLGEVPGPEAGEPGCPDPPDFGCPDVTVPATRPAYPPLPVRYRPVLGERPVTQSAPFPETADVAAAQARRLAGLPGRTRNEVHRLWRKAGREELSEKDIEYLTIVFGADVLRRVELTEHPRRALRTLLARFDSLLERKLERLAELVRRARSGYLLDAGDEGWEIGQTWGKDEGNALDPALPVFRGPAALAIPAQPRAALPALRVEDEHGQVWLPRRDLLDSGPADRHFVGETDDEGRMSLRFGDGRNGLAPYPGLTLTARYRVGNGVAGNVGRDAVARLVLRDVAGVAVSRVRNPLPAAGGVDPEPVADVRQVAAQEARHRLLRAVAAEDYAELAGRTPGVQRAAADLRWTGSWYEARVAVDPLGADVAPDELLDEVRDGLHRYRRIGHDLAVVTATLVPLDLALRVEVQPGYLAGHVREAARRALEADFEPDDLTFGTPVRVSRIVATAAAVAGVRRVAVTRLRRLFGPADDKVLADGVLPIRALEVAQLDNDPSRPENGRIELDVRGGR
ncbi:putative baseplate assembly protein [Amycolatopsis suaedae]|uniref:Putative baseplate assembly protein n=1 Tax=Amycolatopsis suaedae TaxID=2510978 RepID=A0A4Q7J276_9PSEU|nr:putative baseplate assembly protein [Amycolatopsis suaedae]RZQ60044.1 putative baseplate assembly protein [Amycolatopsis suaedae]